LDEYEGDEHLVLMRMAGPTRRDSSKGEYQNRKQTMTKHLHNLLESAKNFPLTPEEKEQQRRSFAYGNTVIENPRITREMVDRAADMLNERNEEPLRRRSGQVSDHLK
jgi:hypothetical protein